MVEVPIKRLMIAGADRGRPDRRRRQVLDDRHGARVRPGVDRPCRHRRAAAGRVPLGRRRRRDRGDGRMKLTIVGGGGLPRAAGLRRAAGEGASGSALEEVVLHDIDADAAGAHRRACSTGSRPSTATRLPFRDDDRPRGRRRGRGLRVLRDPRRPARGPRGRRGRPARARRARPGDDRAGRHLLRAAHDPGDGAPGRDDRQARARTPG